MIKNVFSKILGRCNGLRLTWWNSLHFQRPFHLTYHLCTIHAAATTNTETEQQPQKYNTQSKQQKHVYHTQQYRINPKDTIRCTPLIITLNNKRKNKANTNYKINKYTQHISIKNKTQLHTINFRIQNTCKNPKDIIKKNQSLGKMSYLFWLDINCFTFALTVLFKNW